ncbi:hypothetical protein OO012_07605 [Rhodobacteraceae bacterium KMM 6894]|nr:hypothetical protein [Rhodobacteraceae bacterium KMM 6894]
MTPTQRTLLLIAAFLTLMVGSFIWFVATWDASQKQPVTQQNLAPAYLLAENIPGEALETVRFSASGAEPLSHAELSGALT